MVNIEKAVRASYKILLGHIGTLAMFQLTTEFIPWESLILCRRYKPLNSNLGGNEIIKVKRSKNIDIFMLLTVFLIVKFMRVPISTAFCITLIALLFTQRLRKHYIPHTHIYIHNSKLLDIVQSYILAASCLHQECTHKVMQKFCFTLLVCSRQRQLAAKI